MKDFFHTLKTLYTERNTVFTPPTGRTFFHYHIMGINDLFPWPSQLEALSAKYEKNLALSDKHELANFLTLSLLVRPFPFYSRPTLIDNPDFNSPTWKVGYGASYWSELKVWEFFPSHEVYADEAFDQLNEVAENVLMHLEKIIKVNLNIFQFAALASLAHRKGIEYLSYNMEADYLKRSLLTMINNHDFHEVAKYLVKGNNKAFGTVDQDTLEALMFSMPEP